MNTITVSPCRHCTAPVSDNAFLCHKDTKVLRQHLQAVPTLVQELRTALSKQSNVANDHAPTSADGVQLPFNLGASRALDDLTAVLLSWVKLVHDEKTTIRTEQLGNGPITYWTDHWPLPRKESASAYAGWLIPHLDWLRRHEAAADARSEIARVVLNGQRMIDREDDRLFIGTCGGPIIQETPDGPSIKTRCAEQLYAGVDDTVLICRKCKNVHDVSSRRANALSMAEDRVETAATIARALARAGMGITGERIYNWAKRGHLVSPAKHARSGRPLYRVGDVMELWSRMEAKRVT